MIENLTQATKRLVELAVERAGATACSRVDPVHSLGALVAEPGGGAARILRELRLDPDVVRRDLARPESSER